MTKIQAPSAWNRTHGGENIAILGACRLQQADRVAVWQRQDHQLAGWHQLRQRWHRLFRVLRAGTVVTLNAVPYINLLKGIEYDFDHWEGSCTGSSSTCALTMSGTRSARAVFVRVATSP
jgi:hypothetical protein